MKGIDSDSIDLLLTDPPYGMEFRSNYRKVKHEVIKNDNNLDWLPDFIEESYRVLKDNSHIYLFSSHHKIDVFKQALEKYFEIKNILVWLKNNTGMGDLTGDYTPQCEFVIFAQKGRRELNGRRDSNILRANKTGNNLHPTEKPIDLMEFLITKSSNKGEIVLDPFAGSGSTLIAAELTKRNYIGIEISPEYCRVIEDRLKSITNSLF